MGVFNEILVAGKERAEREKILTQAFEILKEVDRKMSHYKTTSEISRINQKGFESPQAVSPETFEVIQASIDFYQKSRGAFDITVLPLMKLWGFYDGDPHLPRPEAVRRLLPRVNSGFVILNPESREVAFQKPGMEIDLGGIAKGYACDRVVDYLKSEGIQSALVNVGGTIYALGKTPDGKRWRVGLQHPREPARTFQVIPLENEAVATSGDYQQFFVVKGRRYSHILNPKTGYPAERSVAVSVVAPSALLADALSTTLFVLGPDEAPSWAESFHGVRWVLTSLADGERFKTATSDPAP